eukprot:scaffold227518_cov18-Tisochrysis_lutea.AAC.1
MKMTGMMMTGMMMTGMKMTGMLMTAVLQHVALPLTYKKAVIVLLVEVVGSPAPSFFETLMEGCSGRAGTLCGEGLSTLLQAHGVTRTQVQACSQPAGVSKKGSKGTKQGTVSCSKPGKRHQTFAATAASWTAETPAAPHTLLPSGHTQGWMWPHFQPVKAEAQC